jgi:hypothetical protein
MLPSANGSEAGAIGMMKLKRYQRCNVINMHFIYTGRFP